MVSATVYRLTGLGLLLGSILLAAGDIIRVLAGADPPNGRVASGWFILAVGAVLVVLGLPGMYASQMRETGRLGLLGFTGTAVFVLIFGVFGGLLHGLVLPGLVPQVPNIMSLRPASVELAFFSGALLGALGCRPC